MPQPLSTCASMLARSLSLADLEQMYLRLQQMDLEIKTGKIGGELALESLVLELTGVR